MIAMLRIFSISPPRAGKMTLETGGVNEFIHQLYYSLDRPPKRWPSTTAAPPYALLGGAMAYLPSIETGLSFGGISKPPKPSGNHSLTYSGWLLRPLVSIRYQFFFLVCEAGKKMAAKQKWPLGAVNSMVKGPRGKNFPSAWVIRSGAST